jgi:CubicO group peptidase (beta-lactamase class C family)
MDGFWYKIGYNNIFASTARSMARFGLLAQNDFIWNNDTLLKDTVYRHQMVNTSQSLNESYGYLWWLNGKSSFMVPTVPFTFPGSICPHAPNDMFSGIGKNGQIVSVSKSNGIVFVRMGNNPNTGDVSIVLVDSIWSKLTAALCLGTGIVDVNLSNSISIYPNPANELLYIRSNENIRYCGSVSSYDGKDILNFEESTSIDISSFSKGVYFLRIQMKNGSRVIRFIKQ